MSLAIPQMGIFVGSRFCLYILLYSANSDDNSHNYSSFSHRKCNRISKNFTMGCCHLGALEFYIWKSPNQDSPLTAIPFYQLLCGRKNNLMAKNYPFSLASPHDNCIAFVKAKPIDSCEHTMDRLVLPNQSCHPFPDIAPNQFLKLLKFLFDLFNAGHWSWQPATNCVSWKCGGWHQNVTSLFLSLLDLTASLKRSWKLARRSPGLDYY